MGGQAVKKRLVILVFMALLVGVSALVYYTQQKSKNGDMYYSGSIEATQSNLAFQVAGRVTEAYAREGQYVLKGSVLARLDSQEFQSRVDQAQAGLDKAKKSKEQLEQLLEIYTATLLSTYIAPRHTRHGPQHHARCREKHDR
jgi:HlyD family secretion protein